MREKLVLIDGHSILNRAYYGVPDLTNSEGLHTNAVYGFLNIMFKILDEEKPQYFAVAFDLKAPTFRHKMYDQYKGTRKPMQDELVQQVPVIKEVLTAMEVPLMMLEGYEADDLLGTVAKKAEADGYEVSVISGDRDLLQLATDHIKIRIPKTKKGGTEIEDYHTTEVLEKYQVTPIQIIELKALMGDASDNIPGIPGVGEKTAAKIIGQFGTIENAYAHVDEIKPNKAKESLREHYDLAVLSKKLATIETQSPFALDMNAAKLEDLYTPAAFEWMKKLEFKQMLSRFQCESPVNDAEKHFQIVDGLGEIEQLFETAAVQEKIGFRMMIEQGGFAGLSLTISEEQIYYVPVEGFVTAEYLSGKMKQLLENGKKMITLDLKEQLGFLHLAEEEKKQIDDAVIGAYLLNPLKGQYPYEDLAKDYVDMLVPSKAELLGKKGFCQMQEEEPKKALQYACYQSYIAWKSFVKIEKLLKENGMDPLYEEVEMPLVYILYQMEQEGIRVDGETLKVYGEALQARIVTLEKEIYLDAGEEFNINSPKQLGVILFEKMQLPGGKKTKSGYSTAADVLEKLAADHPIVSKILEYRQLTKLKSTYADGLANYICEDGRIHGLFHQTITATGRISSAEPNLQNIPIRTELGRQLRKVFIPKDGYVFIDADYSQIELRVLASMSDDENLIHAYSQASDIHRITASQVFHIPMDEVTDLQRRNAKAVNFGIVYGISSFGLSQDLSISRKEASAYIEQYFKTYPGIKAFLDKTVSDAKELGYAVTLLGRRRPMPELKSSNFMQRSFGERAAMNAPIQGTAADIVKIAMIRVDQRLKKEKLESRLILQVHDELLVETKKEECSRVKAILKEEMTNAVKLQVGLEIDMNEGNDWYEAH